MKKSKVIRLVILAAMLSAAASVAAAADNTTPPTASNAAAAAALAPEVQIPFAERNIWNWQVVDDQTVLIQDQGRRWYKATLFGHCINLPFADRIAFDSNPERLRIGRDVLFVLDVAGTFDKFSAILVRGQRCPLSSLVETSAPPKKLKAKKPDSAPAPQ
jgi:Family of unknown function (DUF6491)